MVTDAKIRNVIKVGIDTVPVDKDKILESRDDLMWTLIKDEAPRMTREVFGL